MSNISGQRIAAFLLALLFLFTSVGATAFVIWQINQGEGGFVNETPEEKAAADAIAKQREEQGDSTAPQCGEAQPAKVDTRPLPTIVKVDGAVAELQSTDIKQGDGEEVQPGDCVAALYHGTLAKDGTKFDGNYETGQPIEFSLNNVITGWSTGIPGMKVNGIRRLVIPAAEAYGDQQRGNIPANSDLIFEVEILNTRRGDTQQ